MMANHIRNIADMPIEVVRPFIRQDIDWGKVSPFELDKNAAIFIGANRGQKGIRDLVEIWPKVRQEHPDATLDIVGEGHYSSYEETPGVNVRGYVENLGDVFSSAALQVHPARFDASPVATLEGMRYGIPQVVTEHTGTKSEVKRVNHDLIADSSKQSLFETITNYFLLDRDKKESYSKAFRQIGEEFEYKNREGDFEQKGCRLLKRIEESKSS
jgi:glycosyltransferase involved in cell wall biosynthesis